MSLKQAAVDTAARKDSRPFSLPHNVRLQDLTPFLTIMSSRSFSFVNDDSTRGCGCGETFQMAERMGMAILYSSGGSWFRLGIRCSEGLVERFDFLVVGLGF